MTNFSDRYIQAFASLGRALRREDSTPPTEILSVEKRLGLRVPAALREYYQIAGRADDFNCAHNRLLPPKDWAIDKGKLVFFEENQAVLLYGVVAASNQFSDDPPVFAGQNDDPIRWHKVNEECSAFLVLMLHLQAAYGRAMPYGGTARGRVSVRKTLDVDWLFVGELHGMRAYHKSGRSVCIGNEGNGDCRVFVGASSDGELEAVANDLSLHWDQPTFRPKWDERAIRSNGVKVCYSVEGKGESVILLHGLMSDSAADWAVPGTVAQLAKKHQVITVDMPGHGLSDRTMNTKAFGLELVKTVIRLMDHLKVEKAHIVGYCLGGAVAAKFLATHQDRVLSGTIGGMGWLRKGNFVEKVFPRFNWRARDSFAICALSVGKLALSRKEVESIHVPVQLVVGEHDEAVKKSYVDPLHSLRKDWPVFTIKEAHHWDCRLKPQLRKVIVEWIVRQARN